MAAELARQLPTPNPLQLNREQKLVAGEHLTKLLKSRVAYHHSGLSYGARAGVIEPLAKAGQLRVVVATMGLAAGINFSLRSVALAACRALPGVCGSTRPWVVLGRRMLGQYVGAAMLPIFAEAQGQLKVVGQI